MWLLTDINQQPLGMGVYTGNYSTGGDKLFLTNITHDFISNLRNMDTYGGTADDLLYYFSF
jgi:hypothetical protein